MWEVFLQGHILSTTRDALTGDWHIYTILIFLWHTYLPFVDAVSAEGIVGKRDTIQIWWLACHSCWLWYTFNTQVYLTLGYVTLCMCAHNTLTLKLNPKLELINFWEDCFIHCMKQNVAPSVFCWRLTGACQLGSGAGTTGWLIFIGCWRGMNESLRSFLFP